MDKSPFMIMWDPATYPQFKHHRRQPIFTAQPQPPEAGLKPEDIATNEFIDPSIGVGA